MRNKYNQGDKVEFKESIYEVERVRIYNMKDVCYLIKDDKGVMFTINQKELEEE